jgi:predicted Rossmann fold flavoprotein
MHDVLILGAGAASLMCASTLASCKEMSVGVIDANLDVGAKIRISGGGKCNITNTEVSEENYLGDQKFAAEVLARFPKDELLHFLKNNGLQPVIRKEHCYFCPKSSDEIISLFKRLTKDIHFYLGESIIDVKQEKDIFVVKSSKAEYRSKHLVVATGGASYKSLGASDIGLRIAEQFGHNVVEFSPALVGMTLQKDQFWMKELSGVSTDVTIAVEGKKVRGEMLFAHRGISGPVVLNASLYWKKGTLAIDFLPDRCISALIKNSNKNLSSVLNLPKRLSKGVLQALDVEDKPCNAVTKEEKQKLQHIHSFMFAPAGNFGFSKAEVSRGGVQTDELDGRTMMSKKIKNLYFIGEVVDITGELGGYNFQWAFSSAYVSATDLCIKKRS